MQAKIKSWWNFKSIRIYEIQTEGAEGSIERCMEKARMFKAELTIVTNSEKVEMAIKEIGKGEIKCIRVDLDNRQTNTWDKTQKTTEQT